MNLPAIPLLDMLRERMAWLNQRQNVLSQNVANADTPGYVARDMKPLDFQSLLDKSAMGSGSQLVVTDPRHITMTSDAVQSADEQASGEAATNPNGNSVSIEEEMMKVADTQAQYQAATNLYAKAIGMMRTAIDKGGN